MAHRSDMANDRQLAALRRLVIWTAIGLAAGCGGQEGGGPMPQGMPPAPVTLAVAEPTDIAETSEYIAALKSLQSTPIQPQVEGQITRIDVRSGQRVATGQPLVQIDARRQQAAVSSEEAEHASKQASVALARSELDRAKALFAAGAISRQELDRADTALRTAEADLKAHAAEVQQGQVQLRYYTVVAPTAGVVGDVPVRIGNQVTPQTVLTTIDQNARLEVHVPVPLARARDLKMGLPIELVDSAGAVVATTTVSFISPRVEEETQSVLVKGIVANPGALRSEQVVRARLRWRSTKGLLIPVLAVTRVGGRHFAFVAEETKGGLVARLRPVKLGPMVGDSYTIVVGIKPKERIVVSGVQKLGDGAPIVPQT